VGDQPDIRRRGQGSDNTLIDKDAGQARGCTLVNHSVDILKSFDRAIAYAMVHWNANHFAVPQYSAEPDVPAKDHIYSLF
jgi:hypothetical protein